MTIFLPLWGLLGVAVGAILNHAADHLPAHRSLWRLPACRVCGSSYRRRQWSALLATALNARRCSLCAAPLARRRYVLEAAMAFLTMAFVLRHADFWRSLVAIFHAAVLCLVVVTDIEHRKIPDAALIPAAAVTFLLTLATCPPCLPRILLGGAIALGIFMLLVLIYPGAMGLGDVTLATYVGLLAGYPRVLICLFVAVLAGGLAAAALLISGRGNRKTFMPYAPYLALGGALALWFL